MPTTVTPLRYPGGKTKLYDYVRAILQTNGLIGGTYCEPFAGGAGLAMKLLLKADVDQLIINDADPAIYAVWNSILNEPDELCDFIQKVDVTVAEWDRQKQIYLSGGNGSNLDLAKATFFLNRTNVSGVIQGGIIGGREQKGHFKIDARFNKKDLINKIQLIASYANRIRIYNLDVLDFMDQIFPMLPDNSFINFDPPYVNKGGKLYKNAFTETDHESLRNKIAQCDKKWMVTYDVCDLIERLYNGYRGGVIDVYYSANDIRKAQEYVFFSDNLLISEN